MHPTLQYRYLSDMNWSGRVRIHPLLMVWINAGACKGKNFCLIKGSCKLGTFIELVRLSPAHTRTLVLRLQKTVNITRKLCAQEKANGTLKTGLRTSDLCLPKCRIWKGYVRCIVAILFVFLHYTSLPARLSKWQARAAQLIVFNSFILCRQLWFHM